MRLVASVARHAVGVSGGVDLREPLGSRGAGSVAANAQGRDVWLAGVNGRVLRVLFQWAVAGLAVYSGVFAGHLGLKDVAVAGLTGLMAREVKRPIG